MPHGQQEFFADVLNEYMQADCTKLGRLSKLSGIHRQTLSAWLTGRTLRPRDWQSVIRVADVLRLDLPATNRLLRAAGHSPVAALRAQARGDSETQQMLARWPSSTGARLPQMPFGLVGRRDELDEAASVLQQGGRTCCLIHGPGGVGKTALAAEVARRLRSTFSDGVIWISAAGRSLVSIVADLADALGVDLPAYGSVDTHVQIVQGVVRGMRVLLVLDDIMNDRVLDVLLPIADVCTSLMTSRQSAFWSLNPSLSIALRPFADDGTDALQLFARIVGSAPVDSERVTYRGLAKRLGHLPILIEIAGRRLAAPLSETPDSLIEAIDAYALPQTLSYGLRSAAALVDRDIQGLDVPVQRAYIDLGIFGGLPFTVEQAAATLGRSEGAMYALLNQLNTLSMVLKNAAGDYFLHQLWQHYLEAGHPPALDSVCRFVDYMVSCVVEDKYNYPRLAGHWSLIDRAISLAEQHALHEPYFAMVQQLALESVLYATARSDVTIWLRTGLTLAQTQGLTETEATILAYLSIGRLYASELDAARRALSDAQALLPQLPPGEAHIVWWLAYGMLERLERRPGKSYAALENALDEAAKAGNDGIIVCYTQWQYTLTSSLFDDLTTTNIMSIADAMVAGARRFGHDRLYLSGLSVRAKVFLRRGELAKAVPLFHEIIQQARVLNLHVPLMTCNFDLCTCAIAEQAYEAALTYAQRALRAAQRLGYEPVIALSQRQIGLALTHLGQYEQAQQALERARELAVAAKFNIAESSCERDLALLALAQHRLCVAHDHVQRGLMLMANNEKPALVLELTLVRGGVALMRRQFDEAEAITRQVLDSAETANLGLIVRRAVEQLDQIAMRRMRSQRLEERVVVQ